MLDQTTKRKIDSARNILVGNVTNPISQVDQITNALIYKFMDDMDQENLEVDLKPQFFVGDYAKYSWTKLLDKKLSGQERMNLYIQATESMSKNPHIPQLFRDIFKGAFLPYNDPRVLTLFLKEIDGFSYSHSEELGNAFEYLLSILGSQGDAGQFRTPRHIIDFIAEVVDPKKNETILDPACGTAGFLISAYKHILKAHDGLDNTTGKPTNKETNLTPAEKTKLMNNIVGYDVDPGMVKLSLVNMYLHGFQDPKIHKYNTLTDEKRWDERFDVIMANPPFMTPKGGIETHKRFSVQANRAEVLFVDYIMEHLSIKGRAGIIVPEGIIFKNDKSYKSLRKKLVEDGLFAVVSLPAGVFQPYSGVKTSVLFFDNQVAKNTDEILFVKVLNDGYDLGAQRRPRPDLPNDLFNKGGALDVLKAQSVAIQTGNKNTLVNNKSLFAWTVKKAKIFETGDYNLTGERYREVEEYKNQKWPIVELGDVCEVLDSLRKPVKKGDRKKGDYPYYGATGILDYVDKYIFDEKLVLVGEDGAKWGVGDKTAFIADGKYWVNNHAHVLRPNREKLLDNYLVPILNSQDLSKYVTGITVPKLNQAKLRSIKIPLPPLEVQKEIVEQIEVKQNAIDHAKAIIQNLERERRYFGQALRKIEGVEWVELGTVCETTSGGTPLKSKQEFYENGTIPWLKSGEVNQGFIYKSEEKITVSGLKNSSAKMFPVNTVLVAMYGATAGKVGILKFESSTNQAICGILQNDKFVPEFLYFYLRTLTQKMVELSGGGAQPNISQTIIKTLKIPLPSLEIQKKLVAEAEKEQQIINANKQLIEIMEQKISDVLSEI